MIKVWDWAAAIIFVDLVLGTINRVRANSEAYYSVQGLFSFWILEFIVLEGKRQMIVNENSIFVSLAEFVTVLILDLISVIAWR